MSQSNSSNEWVLAALVSVISFVPAILLRGWVTSVLWLWFIAEPFDAPAIGVAHCVGLGGLWAFVTFKYDDKEKQKKDPTQALIVRLVCWFFLPLEALGIGWIIHEFM